MSNSTLKIQYADGRTEERSLAPGVYKVGRDVGDIVLGDPNTSARHAEIQVQPGRVTIIDVGSTNGTYDPSGNRISGPHAMQAGAAVRLGHSSITLVPDGLAPGGTRVMSADEFQPPPGMGAPPQPPVPTADFAPPPVAMAAAGAAGGAVAAMGAPPPNYGAPPQNPGFGAPPAGGYGSPQGGYPGAPPQAGFGAPAGGSPAYVPLAPSPNAYAPAASSSDDKTVAILSYCTLLGWIVAFIMHNNNKTELGAFHLRQTLGFFIFGFVGGIAVSITSIVMGIIAMTFIVPVFIVPAVSGLFGLAMLALWILGIVAAVGGKMTPMPVVGPLFQKWFANAFR